MPVYSTHTLWAVNLSLIIFRCQPFRGIRSLLNSIVVCFKTAFLKFIVLKFNGFRGCLLMFEFAQFLR